MEARQEATPRGYSDKEIADRMQVMDVLAENREEFQALMALRGITEDQSGYHAFALNFAKNKLRDRALQNEFINEALAKATAA